MEKHTDWSQESCSSQDSCDHYFQVEPDTNSRICRKCGKNRIGSNFRNDVQFDPSIQGRLLGRNLQAGQNDFNMKRNRNFKEMDLIGKRMKIPEPVVEQGKSLYRSIRDNSNIRPTFLKQVTLYTACRKDAARNNKMVFDFLEDSNLEKRDVSRTYFRVMKNDIENYYAEDSRRQCDYPPRRADVMLNRFFDDCFPQQRTASDVRTQIVDDAYAFCERWKENLIDVGRIPSGIYGASLLMACKLNKKELSIKTVAEKARLSQSTIQKRLSEFSDTPDVEQPVDDYLSTPIELWHTNDLHPCMKGKITDYFIHTDPPEFDESCYLNLTPLGSLLSNLDRDNSASGEDISLGEEDEDDVNTYILNADEVEFKTNLWEKEFESSIHKRIRRPKIHFKAKDYRNITHYLSPISSQPRDEQTTAIETTRSRRRPTKKILPVIADPTNSQITEFFSQTSLSPNNSQSSEISQEIPIISSQPDPLQSPLFEEVDKDLPPIHPFNTPTLERGYAYAYSPVPMDLFPTPPTPPDSECEDSLDPQLSELDYTPFSPSSSGSNAGNRP